MTVSKSTLAQGIKIISFKYLIAKLFDDVSLETLTMADKMDKGQNMSDSDRIDEYGLSNDEEYQFNNFLAEGHTKVFSKLLKMTYGLVSSIKLNFEPEVTIAAKKKVIITLSGTSGSADITQTGVGAKEIAFDTDLATTALTFANTFSYDYTVNAGIDLTFNENTIVLEADTAGTDFPNPTIVTTAGNLAGVVTVDTPNVVGETADPYVAVTIRDKEGYNDNYIGIIDNEVYLALKNYILKEWYVKCLLGDQAKFYEMKYIENMKAIQKYGLMLRKPRSIWSAPA